MHCSKVLDTLSPLENLSIVIIVDLAGMDALRATMSRLNHILVLFVRHVEIVRGMQSKRSDTIGKRCRPDDDQTHTIHIIYIRLATVLPCPRKIRPACWYLGIWGRVGAKTTAPLFWRLATR
jgi:hypothetical protein